MTSTAGAILEDSDYYPFGGERVVLDTTNNNYKFTGKERDLESFLDYFGARYYASNLGRFTSPDEFTGGPVDAFSSSDPLPPGPLPYADAWNPQSLNKYSYALNNPVRYIDPNGHDALSFTLGLVNSISNNITLGASARIEREDADFKAGQVVGDIVSTIGGGIEATLGAGIEVGGLALDATGVGAVVGVPANVVGAAVILHGRVAD